MNIMLHIDRLILDGVPLEAGGKARLQAAVESELGRLLTEGGLNPGLLSGRALPSISVDAIQLARQPSPKQLGGQIAQAVYNGIGRK
jgi:hypothetical protein